MKRVLVVEDDPDIVELIDHYLKAEGFEIDAINGAVVREAERLGISVPYNQMTTDLVKVIEKTLA